MGLPVTRPCAVTEREEEEQRNISRGLMSTPNGFVPLQIKAIGPLNGRNGKSGRLFTPQQSIRLHISGEVCYAESQEFLTRMANEASDSPTKEGAQERKRERHHPVEEQDAPCGGTTEMTGPNQDKTRNNATGSRSVFARLSS
jgi:hypothetical protein